MEKKTLSDVIIAKNQDTPEKCARSCMKNLLLVTKGNKQHYKEAYQSVTTQNSEPTDSITQHLDGTPFTKNQF